MEIYALKNHLVQCNSLTSAYPYKTNDNTTKNLVLGNIYTVERTSVYRSYTHVYLKEVPNVPFCTSQFADAIKQPDHWKQGHIDYWYYQGLIAKKRNSKFSSRAPG